MARFHRSHFLSLALLLISFPGFQALAEVTTANAVLPISGCDSTQGETTQSQIADELLNAGYDAYTKGDHRSAKAFWLEASHCSSRVPAWPKAMYNLGLTEQRDGSPARAIGYFQRVLDSHPNDKEAGANITEAYRNYSY
jgi:tetratricopeptide (TPR) repeat protein